MMCIWSVKEGTDLSPICNVLSHTIGGEAQNLSGKHTHSGSVFAQG